MSNNLLGWAWKAVGRRIDFYEERDGYVEIDAVVRDFVDSIDWSDRTPVEEGLFRFSLERLTRARLIGIALDEVDTAEGIARYARAVALEQDK